MKVSETAKDLALRRAYDSGFKVGDHGGLASQYQLGFTNERLWREFVRGYLAGCRAREARVAAQNQNKGQRK